MDYPSKRLRVHEASVPLFEESPAVPGGSVSMIDAVSSELLEDEGETFDLDLK